MAMRFWRCWNPKCADSPSKPGHDFVAEKPVCDKCEIDRANVKFAHLIVPRRLIHFDPPSEVDHIGLNTIACQPTEEVGKHLATASTTTVNCPACRETEAWKKAHKAHEFNPHDDVDLVLDLAKGMSSRA